MDVTQLPVRLYSADMCAAFSGDSDSPALKFPAEISQGCRDTITNLLALDPADRMTAEQAMVDPWITGHACSAVLLDSPVKLIRQGMRQRRQCEAQKENEVPNLALNHNKANAHFRLKERAMSH